MPLFEYRCPQCAATREVLVRGAEAAVPAPTCSHCGVPMEKAWAPVAKPGRSGGSACSAPRRGFS